MNREYPKIQSVFMRDEKTHKFKQGQWALWEFKYLKDCQWIFTEKVDGTNIRVEWNPNNPINPLLFAGRTDTAQIPTFLLLRLQQIFNIENFKKFYPETAITLYGEGYGARIQKGGGNYKPDGVEFILFDVLVDNYWFDRKEIRRVAFDFKIDCVPIIEQGTIEEATKLIKNGLKSQWGDFLAEGLVLKTLWDLQDKNGNRIITKLKHKDF